MGLIARTPDFDACNIGIDQSLHLPRSMSALLLALWKVLLNAKFQYFNPKNSWLLSCCRVAVSVLCLFLTVPWVGLWSVIVVFLGHTHLLTPWSLLTSWCFNSLRLVIVYFFILVLYNLYQFILSACQLSNHCHQWNNQMLWCLSPKKRTLLLIACWVIFKTFCRLLIFSKIFLKRNPLKNTIRMSNSLDPDQARH